MLSYYIISYYTGKVAGNTRDGKGKVTAYIIMIIITIMIMIIMIIMIIIMIKHNNNTT